MVVTSGAHSKRVTGYGPDNDYFRTNGGHSKTESARAAFLVR